MNRITIDKKKYVIVPEKEYKTLQKKASQKSVSNKILSLKEGKAKAYQLIERWARDEK